jgi:hypothetical protein
VSDDLKEPGRGEALLPADESDRPIAAGADNPRSADPPLSLWQRLLDWLFGRDFFISYRWSDARDYAWRLAERLKSEGYDCFLDSDGFLKGDNWEQIGDRELRKTSRLVLVGSPEVHESEAVARELRVFGAKGDRIIAIEFGDSLSRDRYPMSPVLALLDPAAIQQTEPSAALGDDPSDELIAELKRTFTVETTARRRRRAIQLTTVLLASLTLLAAWLHLSSEWRSRSLEFQAAAEAAEERRSFAEAEMAWARAAAVDFRRRNALLPRYQGARKRRLLTPAYQIDLDGDSLLWMGTRNGRLVLAFADSDETKIRLWSPEGRSVEIPKGEDWQQRFAGTDHGIAVLSGELVWLVPWSLDLAPLSLPHGLTMGVWATGYDTPDLRVKDGKVQLFGLAGDEATLLEISPDRWGEPRRVVLDPMPGAGAMRIAESDSWTVVGARLVEIDGSPAAFVELMAWSPSGERTTLRTGIRPPDGVVGSDLRVTEILPSLDDQQMFLFIEESLPDLPGLRQGPSYPGGWISVDVDPRREPIVVGTGRERPLPLYAWDDSEAVLDDGNGEVSLLTWMGPPLLARPIRVVRTGVDSWALLDPGKGMKESPLLGLVQENRVRLMRGLEEVFAETYGGLDTGSQSTWLHSTRDGSWLALEIRPDGEDQNSRLILLRVGRPDPVRSIPRPNELKEEFRPKSLWIREVE